MGKPFGPVSAAVLIGAADGAADAALALSERMTGIEPASSVWKTEALPLSYIRTHGDSTPQTPEFMVP